MEVWVLTVAAVSFVGAMALPMLMPGWRSLLLATVAAAAFFAWLAAEIETPGSLAQAIGGFVGGLLLLGYASGAIARFVALVGRRQEPPDLKN